MGLLYSQYTSPLNFIDALLEMNDFEDGIKAILEQDNEEKMWELYLHSNPYLTPQKSFEDWKKGILTKSSGHSKALTEEQVKVEVQRSQEVLNNFQMKVGD